MGKSDLIEKIKVLEKENLQLGKENFKLKSSIICLASQLATVRKEHEYKQTNNYYL